MSDRMQELNSEQMTKIHDASMAILEKTGIVVNEKEGLEIFKKNGFKVENKTVFPTEKQIRNALSTAPESFTVYARNPEKNVIIGGDHYVFLPGYGSPYIIDGSGDQREALMEDYDNFCRLIQTSKYIDMNGWMMVEPSDMPPSTVHLDMTLANILLCDKPFMGSPASKQAALEGIEMAGIAWGGKQNIVEKPVTVSLINSLSPLQYSEEMAGSLIELARHGQAMVVASLIIAGASGPVTLAGVLAMQNAEILTGLALAQLIRPGVPIIYGSTSSAMDMKTGGLSIGAPELSKNINYTAQMANFYKLPSRSGGGLTDALYPDAQAGVESAIAIYTAARNGIHFILHAAGILGSYIAMSFEKFLIDEEVCGMVRNMLKPMAITDETLDVETICQIGPGGQYLTNDKTFRLCRTEFFLPDLMVRTNYDAWSASGKKKVHEVADSKVTQRLAKYEKPDIDAGIEKDLTEYVNRRKQS